MHSEIESFDEFLSNMERWEHIGLLSVHRNMLQSSYTYLLTILLSSEPKFFKLINPDVLIKGKDRNGNTPLHYSILLKKKSLFNKLIRISDIDINACNAFNEAPIHMAAVSKDPYYLKALLRRNAQVNIGNLRLHTPLHLAVCHSQLNTRILLERGSSINVDQCDYMGRSPLILACYHRLMATVYMLLYYNADASSPLVLLTAIRRRLCHKLQEILAYYLVPDDPSPVSLEVLKSVADAQYFPYILERTSTVLYNDTVLTLFCGELPLISPRFLRVLSVKCPQLFRDLFLKHNVMEAFARRWHSNNHKIHERFLEFYLYFLESDFHDILFESWSEINPIIFQTICQIMQKSGREEQLAQLLCHMLSRNVQFGDVTVFHLYQICGYGELLKIFLHMDLKSCPWYPEMLPALPILLIRTDINLNQWWANPPTHVRFFDMYSVLGHFSHRHLKNYILRYCRSQIRACEAVRRPPQVPSLKELSRNTARIYIVEKLKLRNSSQFYTVVNKSSLPDDCKKLLTLERKVYCI